MKYNRSVKELFLDKNKLFSHSFSELRQLLWTNNCLKLLSMNECEIGDNGANAIAEGFIRNNTLTHLLLRNNNITDIPGKEILEGLQFPRQCPIEVLNLANNLLGEESSVLLVKILPNLKNPPKKLNLENNILKTNKYKLLRIFVMKDPNSNQLEKYKTEKRIKRKELFKIRVCEEKEQMRDDPQEFLQTQKDIRKMNQKKRQYNDEVYSMNLYKQKQILRLNK